MPTEKLPECVDCRICGGEALLFCHDKSFKAGHEGHSVDCEDCSNVTRVFDTEAMAISAWNHANTP